MEFIDTIVQHSNPLADMVADHHDKLYGQAYS